MYAWTCTVEQQVSVCIDEDDKQLAWSKVVVEDFALKYNILH
jgi:hypothetical protein